MIAGLADRALVLGLVASVAFGAGWKVNGWRLGEGIAQDKAEAVSIVRVIERAQQNVADVEGEHGHAELENARRAADAARATAAGLRAEARSLATGLASCNASTAAERQARERAAELLADLLGSMEQEGRGMAETADRSRIAGATCERIYDGIRKARQ